MSILIDVLNELPTSNAVAFDAMLQELSEEDVLFLENHFEKGAMLPSNIINRINQAFKNAGYLELSWDNYDIKTINKRFGFD